MQGFKVTNSHSYVSFLFEEFYGVVGVRKDLCSRLRDEYRGALFCCPDYEDLLGCFVGVLELSFNPAGYCGSFVETTHTLFYVSVQADFAKLPAVFINDGAGIPSR